jgi:hypothetical protein
MDRESLHEAREATGHGPHLRNNGDAKDDSAAAGGRWLAAGGIVIPVLGAKRSGGKGMP